MKEPKEDIIEVQNGNIKPNEPEEKEKQEYPVEVKAHEQSNNSVEIDDNDTLIQLSVRIGFIRKVYGILTIQLLITFGTVLICQLKPIKFFIFHNQIFAANLLIFSFSLFIILYLVLACCRSISRKVPYNYLFLLGITLCQTISCAITSSIYSFQIVSIALVLTIISTFAISFYACTTKNNFSTCRIGLYVIFSQMFTIGIIAVLFRVKALYTFYTFCSTICVGIYLVYDTQIIIGKLGVGYSIDDYIFAALEIYIDIIRLFLYILKIVGNIIKKN